MKAQISRARQRRGKRYTRVSQQQGRMITDADWNELVERLKLISGQLDEIKRAIKENAKALRTKEPNENKK